MRKAVILSLFTIVLTCNTAMAAKQPESGHALKQQVLHSLNNLEVLTINAGLPTALLDAIESNRRAINAMAPEDYAELSPVLKSQLRRVDTMTTDLKVAFQHRSGLRIIKSAGFPEANYPDVQWDFVIDAMSEAPGEGSTSDASDGICNGTGYTPNQTFAAMNGALIAEAIKDTAEQACNETVLVNASLACIVTDIAYFAAKGIYDNFNLCNDFVTAAEVNGSYRRLGHIHDDLGTVKTNLQNAEASILQAISEHDARLRSHDTNIRNQVSTHDTDVKNQVAAHDAAIRGQVNTHDGEIKALLATLQSGVDGNGEQLELLLSRQLEVIRLLHTPQGQRTSDVPACDGGPCRWNYGRGR